MQFSLAYIKSDQQFALRTFPLLDEDNARGKVMNLDEIADHNIQGIFLPESLLNDDSTLQKLADEVKTTPIKKANEVNLTIDSFEAMDADMAEELTRKIQTGWVLQNNLKTLETLIPTIKHLKGLWPNDRTAFFEELWAIIRRNLGTTKLDIIFNDMEVIQTSEEREKKKLIQVKIEGTKSPNPVPGAEFEKELMSHYDKDFGSVFKICDFDAEKGQLVFTATINKSPMVIMATVNKLTGLQRSLFQALFDGLQA